MLQQALVAHEKIKEGAKDAFYSGKIQTVKFYVRNILPDVMATVRIIKEADTSAMACQKKLFKEIIGNGER